MLERLITISLFGILSAGLTGQTTAYSYEVSKENLFGLPNPDAPEQLKDFALLIGECDCESVSRKANQTWADPVEMIWKFKYIMNGTAIQDETLKADGSHTGSIRQFNIETKKWQVHFYATNNPSSPLMTWEGKRNEKGDIILYRNNPSPQGTPGFYKISFYNIKETGFDWLGEWVNPEETIQYPLWKIFCKKRV
ncbi:hypothetical protein [Croceitalea rosinachiae]|uniref:Uncharacterized protein n=1 Tax=Croceitalea rosinachiae TaxID=3075596 RepID=A0ABU3AEA4_9FLAO|nr:hypothetical protein [Croceitalea sp. F388]MDT0608513.1 hypothetical protein [Croceitalea sp. F388]